jgi:tetratricopeptide (TPR) repeat protein
VVARTLARLADVWPSIAEALKKRNELALAGQPTQGENAKLLARYIEIDAAGPAAIQLATLRDLGKVTDPTTLADMYLVESWGAKTSAEAIALLDKAIEADADNKSGHLPIFRRAHAGRLMTARDGKRLLIAVADAMQAFPEHEEIDWFWTAKVRAYQLLEDWKKGIETADAALRAIGDSPWRRAIENMKRDFQAALAPCAVAWAFKDDVDAAVAEAKKTNKLVLAWFVGEDAAVSQMALETLGDGAVGTLAAERFVTVRVARPDLLAKHKVDPGTALVIASNGREWSRLSGFFPPRVWMRKLARAADALPEAVKLLGEHDAAEKKGDAAAADALKVKLAQLYLDIDRLGQAREWTNKLVSARDPAAVATVQLVTGLVAAAAERNLEAALAAFEKGLAADPNDASGRVESLMLEKANVLFSKRDYRANLAIAEEAIKRFPKSERLDWWWIVKVRALINLGERQAAADAAGAALAAMPDAPWRKTLEAMREEATKK